MYIISAYIPTYSGRPLFPLHPSQGGLSIVVTVRVAAGPGVVPGQGRRRARRGVRYTRNRDRLEPMLYHAMRVCVHVY